MLDFKPRNRVHMEPAHGLLAHAKRVKQMLVTPDMSDDEIERKIRDDMHNLAVHEAGSGWRHLATILGGSSTDRILSAGFKAVVDQNKIMIRQNELILRTLRAKVVGGALALREKTTEGATNQSPSPIGNVRVPERIRTCQVCGFANAENAAFCQSCGARLIQLPAPPADSIYRERCPYCGYAKNRVADRFCRNCGKRL